jgi:hypothetical protein
VSVLLQLHCEMAFHSQIHDWTETVFRPRGLELLRKRLFDVKVRHSRAQSEQGLGSPVTVHGRHSAAVRRLPRGASRKGDDEAKAQMTLKRSADDMA